MKIVVGTTNQSKIMRLQKLLHTDIDLIPINNLFHGEEAPENLSSADFIAAEKALYYLDKIDKKYPVLTQDDTLFLHDIKDSEQPGRSIKAPVIKKYGEFNTENAVRYYTELAAKHGGSIPIEFRYGHSLAFASNLSDNKPGIFSFTAQSTLKGILVTTPKNLDKFQDYFLAAIMVCEVAGKQKYYSELTDDELVCIDNDIKKSLHLLLADYEDLLR